MEVDYSSWLQISCQVVKKSKFDFFRCFFFSLVFNMSLLSSLLAIFYWHFKTGIAGKLLAWTVSLSCASVFPLKPVL